MTGISNPYIRVTLISSRECETVRSSCSKNLNLPSKPSCKLDGIEDVNLRDCLLKFVVLDFDRFSRSEFVAEVLVSLGDLGDLRAGVRICEELMLQQKVMVSMGMRGNLGSCIGRISYQAVNHFAIYPIIACSQRIPADLSL